MAASSRATMRLRSSSVFRFSGRAKCDDASRWGSLLIQVRAAYSAASSSVNNKSRFISRSPGSRLAARNRLSTTGSDDLYGHLSGLRRGLGKKIVQGGPKCNSENYQDRGRKLLEIPEFRDDFISRKCFPIPRPMFVDALSEFLASPAQRVDCYIPRKKGGLTSRPFLLYNSTAPELKKLLGRKAGETLELETKLRLMIPESGRAESRPICWSPK